MSFEKEVADRKARDFIFRPRTILVIESPGSGEGLDKLDLRWKEYTLFIEANIDYKFFLENLSEKLHREPMEKIVFLSLNSLRLKNITFYRKFESDCLALLQNYWRNRSTLRFHARRWMRNIIENLSYAYPSYQNQKTEKEVWIIGAGPSLDDKLTDITKRRDELFLVVVDTAIKSLLSWGIRPDIIILAEGQWFTLDDFPLKSLTGIELVADLVSHAPTLRYAHNNGMKVSLFMSNYYNCPFLHDLSKISDYPLLPSLGSVGVIAALIGKEMAHKSKLKFCGLDFANRSMASHAKYTPQYENYLNHNRRLLPTTGSSLAFAGTNEVLSSYRELLKYILEDDITIGYEEKQNHIPIVDFLLKSLIELEKDLKNSKLPNDYFIFLGDIPIPSPIEFTARMEFRIYEIRTLISRRLQF